MNVKKIPLVILIFMFFVFLLNFKTLALDSRNYLDVFNIKELFFSSITAIQLCLTFFVFFIIGHFFLHKTKIQLWFTEYKINFFHKIITGQILLIIYCYLRFFINYIFNIVVPVSILDIILIVSLIFFYYYKKFNNKKQFTLKIKNYFIDNSYFIFIVFLILFILALRELPRVVSLSLDPNTHAFFAQQIKRFGTLPYLDHFYWGNKNFTYPSAFAILNFLWMTISNMGAIDITTIQVPIQAILGLFIIAETINNKEKITSKHFCYLLLFISLIYFNFLFYGFQNIFFDAKATPRSASIIFEIILFCFIANNLFNFNKERSSNFIFYNYLFIFIVATISFLHNPINIFITYTLVTISILSNKSIIKKFYIVILSHIGLLLAFFDPYILDKIIKRDMLVIVNSSHIIEPFIIKNFINELFNSFNNVASFKYFHYFFNLQDFFSFKKYLTLLSFIIAITLAYTIISKNKKTLNILLIQIFTPFVFFIVFSFAFFSSSTLSKYGTEFYLIPSYTLINIWRANYAFLMFSTITVLYFTVKWLLHRSKEKNYIIIISALIFTLLVSGITDLIKPSVTYDLRKFWLNYGNKMISKDIPTIKKIEQYKTNYLFKNKIKDKNSFPKILISNGVVKIGAENWIIPTYSAAILPYYDVFPLAFFTTHIDTEYSYKNYNEKVCKSFDINWFKEKNIKFLYVPSNDSGCIFNTEKTLSSLKLLIKDSSEGAAFYELW